MAGVNKVILVGNLGNDPEVKTTQGGMVIAAVSLATTEKRKDRDGNYVDATEWHRLKFFGKLAEIAEEYLRKGASIYVEGKIKYDKYTGQDGVEKFYTEILVDNMQMLGAKAEGGQQRTQQQERPAQQPRSSAPAARTGGTRQAPRQAPAPVDDFPIDDDIPF